MASFAAVFVFVLLVVLALAFVVAPPATALGQCMYVSAFGQPRWWHFPGAVLFTMAWVPLSAALIFGTPFLSLLDWAVAL